MLPLSHGAVQLLTSERQAASHALSSKIYVLYRRTNPSPTALKRDRSVGDFCTRVGPTSLCFCGETFERHEGDVKQGLYRIKRASSSSSSPACRCKQFEYVPSRPEEVGDEFLCRRRGFNVNTWKVKCKCSHSHLSHSHSHSHTDSNSNSNSKRCKECNCACFTGAFMCGACEGSWEEHETAFETESERRRKGLPVGDAFIPLSDTPVIQEMVFGRTRVGRDESSREYRSSSSSSSSLQTITKSSNTSPSSRAVMNRPSPSPNSATNNNQTRSTRTLEDQFEAGEISSQQYNALVTSMNASTITNNTINSNSNSNSNSNVKYEVGMQARTSTIAPKFTGNVRPDRSVLLSHVSSGGVRKGKVLNRFGKSEK